MCCFPLIECEFGPAQSSLHMSEDVFVNKGPEHLAPPDPELGYSNAPSPTALMYRITIKDIPTLKQPLVWIDLEMTGAVPIVSCPR